MFGSIFSKPPKTLDELDQLLKTYERRGTFDGESIIQQFNGKSKMKSTQSEPVDRLESMLEELNLSNSKSERERPNDKKLSLPVISRRNSNAMRRAGEGGVSLDLRITKSDKVKGMDKQ